MQKILQNLKYFGQDVSMNIDTKRTYTSLNNEMEHSSEAQSSKGPNNETVQVTKWIRMVGKVPLIEINPDKWTTFQMDPVKRASIMA